MLVDGEDVGLLDALRVDALVALHMRQRRQPVAIDRGALEIEVFGGLLHLPGNLGLHLLAAAGEEILRLLDEFGIVRRRDLAGARARAALDLVEQAGPRAALEDRIGAGAEQERPLQRIDGAADRARRGERPEIVALARARAAMLEDAGRRMVAGQHDVGERLVVPHQHVEARPQAA